MRPLLLGRVEGNTAAVTRRRLTVGTVIQLASRVLGALFGVVVAASLARSLSRTEFGELSLVLTLVTLAASVMDLGINQIAVREMAARPEARSRITGALTVAQLLTGAALGAIALVLAIVLLHGTQARIMAILIVLTLPLGALGALTIAAQARLRPELYILPTFVQSVAWLAIVLVLGASGAHLALYGVGFLVASLVQSASIVVMSAHVTTVRFDGALALIVELLKVSWPMGVAGMFVTAYYKIDGILLFHFHGAIASAYYSASYRVIDVLQILPMTVSGVVLPLATTLHREGSPERSRRLYDFAAVILVAVAAPVIVCGVILAPGIVGLVYGPKYHRSILLLQILLPAFLPICLSYLLTSRLIVLGRLRPYIAITGCAAVLNIAANVIGLPRYGAPLAGWATVGTELLVTTAVGLVGRRALGLGLPIRRCLWCVAAGLPVELAVWLVRHESLIVGLAIAVIFYPVCLIGSRAVSMSDLRAFVSERNLARA